ncbi:MAG TPA: hypothetical protein VG298_16160 [Acidimicrobiales bacterium]|nr:hypothetical protein [Acidimicrobiales bacterium]
MPPEVTRGFVVVVVGAVVVGVVVDESDPFVAELVGSVVLGLVVGSGVVEDEVEVEEVVVVEPLAPECSLATTTPITAVAPVAASTTERVSRRRRA